MQLLSPIQVVSMDKIPAEARSPHKSKDLPVALVVDDERVIADTLSIILGRSGFAVQTAYDASSALELAGVIPPHLLLSDVMMGPGMDGTQLAMELITLYPDCKVILFSGHTATHELLEKARERGHNFTLLNKPLHPADLLACIQNSLIEAPALA